MKDKMILDIILIIVVLLVSFNLVAIKKQSERIEVLEKMAGISREEIVTNKQESKKENNELNIKEQGINNVFIGSEIVQTGLWDFLSLVFETDGNVWVPTKEATAKFYTDISLTQEIEDPHLISTRAQFVDEKNANYKCLLMEDGNICYTDCLDGIPIEKVENSLYEDEKYKKIFEEEPLKESMIEFIKLEFKIDGKVYELREDSDNKYYTDVYCTEEVENPIFISNWNILVNRDNYYFYAIPLLNGQIVYGDDDALLELKEIK